MGKWGSAFFKKKINCFLYASPTPATMSRKAVFPGSFDPVTNGHLDIIRRALPLFDELVVAIGCNSQKSPFFPLEKREAWMRELLSVYPNVSVQRYEGLTVRFCRSIGASYIVRGLRTSADFEFERGIAQMNKAMEPGVETVFIISDPALSAISSGIVRDILRNGGDVSGFVPVKVS
jgi:pantetheine-phosphate adenylyltransferase